MTTKPTLALLFGGQSPEHDISLISAQHVNANLDRQRYDILLIYISRQGGWYLLENIDHAPKPNMGQVVSIVPDEHQSYLLLTSGQKRAIDIAFPMLHGVGGEDGTIQGLLEFYNIPYVGCGPLSSTLILNKAVTKRLCQFEGMPVPEFITIAEHEWQSQPEVVVERVKQLPRPWFIKPVNSGSSIGFTKTDSTDALASALPQAFQYDHEAIIESAVMGARDIEVALLGDETPLVSQPGEVVPDGEYYDYYAKYVSDRSQLLIPAPLSKHVTQHIQALAVKLYKRLHCYGMVRIDFFVRRDDEAVFVNEANTIPGFTTISLYPRLWQLEGINYSALLDRLIELGYRRFQKRKVPYQADEALST